MSVILNDALFVHADHAEGVAVQLRHGKLPSIREAYNRGYADWPGITSLFPWNQDVAKWLDERTKLAVRGEMVRSYFKLHGDGEGIGQTYPFVVKAKPGSWPCAPMTNDTIDSGAG